MITCIKGKLIQKSPTFIVIDVGGIGYFLNISMNTFENLPLLEKDVFIYTEMIVREDSITLYGFHSESERQLFRLLISVSGIGPKSGIGILSGVSLNEFKSAILTANTTLLQKLPGIGKKTAERLIVELKDKFAKLSIHEEGSILPRNDSVEEATLALESLGYNKSMANKAVNSALKQIDSDNYSSEDLIKLALKFTLK
ncbi:MAG: Holliday junction branch migration protein RuvA [Ignavibacteriae bacterium HGW-Ignavibacteriae-4]|jgi:Holliday junction DNA helicase RuvA|nr:MAG: Holliday junction branch migration protein RuvA [Ignavibacteriae bacterium HGW-Ignavibacteriae-4]